MSIAVATAVDTRYNYLTMNETNKTGRKMTLRQRQMGCTHGTTIELADGIKVCTCCEKVLK